MPANHPNPRPAGGILIVLLLIALVPAVSAYTQTFAESQTDYGYGEFSGAAPQGTFTTLKAKNIVGLQGVDSYAYINPIDGLTSTQRTYFADNNYGHTSITGTIGADTIFSGVITYNSNLHPDSSLKEVIFAIKFDTIDIKSYTGEQTITLTWNQTLVPPGRGWGDSVWTNMENANPRYTEYPIALSTGTSGTRYMINGKHSYYDLDKWSNTVNVTETDLDYTVDFLRGNNPSRAEISDADTGVIVYASAYTTDDVTFDVNKLLITSSRINVTVISSTGNVYTLVYPPSAPSSPVTIYIKNSQTGALLANAHLSILAASGDPPELYEVVNTTLPGGTGVYNLQPTGGGSPNPDYYRAVATVPGFSQIIENHSFTLNGPHDVIIEMRPDSGGPADPERAYLEFYVRDFAANPIPAASVQCGGRILQTNSAGYAVFEVSKNSTHPWIAKKSGYTTIEGTATTGPNPRYVVNVVLGPGTVPTYTPTTGETPGATPTPDTRTNEQKGQEVIDLIADFALPIAILAILATLSGLLSMMMPRRR